MKKLFLALALLASSLSLADTTGLPVKGTALHLTPQAGSPPAACLPVGQVCIWYDSNVSMWKFRAASGIDLTSGYSVVESHATTVAQRPTVNFTGGVTCADNAGAARTDCTVAPNQVANTSALTSALAATTAAGSVVIVRSTGGGFTTYDNANWSALW